MRGARISRIPQDGLGSTWYPTDTSYNSMQIKVDRRFRGGWLMTNSYTFGRSIDYSDDNGGVGTPADPELSKATGSGF